MDADQNAVPVLANLHIPIAGSEGVANHFPIDDLLQLKVLIGEFILTPLPCVTAQFRDAIICTDFARLFGDEGQRIIGIIVGIAVSPIEQFRHRTVDSEFRLVEFD